jgi:hypothetical protein
MEKLFGAINQPSILHGAVMAVGSLQAQESLVHYLVKTCTIMRFYVGSIKGAERHPKMSTRQSSMGEFSVQLTNVT